MAYTLMKPEDMPTHSQFVELNERVRIVGWAMSPDEPDTAVLEIMRLV